MVACGPSRTEEGLHVGLLFIAAHVTREQLTLSDGRERTPVSIPIEYLNLPEPQWFTGVTLEVTT